MAEDPKLPSSDLPTQEGQAIAAGPPALPGAADLPTGAAPAIPVGKPPAMPSDGATAAAPAIAFGAPPALPIDASSTGPIASSPTLPTGAQAIGGTIQMKIGPVDQAAPVLPTMRGEAGAAQPAFGTPPEMPPDERYELGDEIARGGMGRVVEAMDTLLGRTVALKEALTTDPEHLRRFARETRITAKLEHPSIVPVHDAGTLFGGVPFYVMRKVSGRPLEALVARAATLEDRLALVPHMLATAHAIAHAHERGIVHRDIKPSNILVGDNGETIVIDWGLAKVIGEADEPVPLLGVGIHGSRVVRPVDPEPGDIIKTRAGIVYGTPGFMAPEQLRGAAVNELVDVYALGATLYHLLARKPPHHAKTADEMMHAAVAGPPVPLAELVPGVPPELTTIVDKALAHDPAKRYANAGEVADDLQRFLTGQLIASHHYSRKEKLVRFVRKHRTPVTITAAATLAMIVVGVIAVSRIVAARDRADHAAEVAVAQRKVAEEERARAEERADALTLTQARNEVETNPTRALAMLKPLAGKRPDDVRSIAIAARASGVAWSLPASRRTSTLELSRDGRRALAAGDDGIVRLYDLDARTAKTLVEAGAKVSARFADNERRVVLWGARGPNLVIFDIASGQREERALSSHVRDLELVGTTAYWVDEHGALWQLDLASKTPAPIALDERLSQLTPSPDGRWIALYGEFHLLLLDRTTTEAPKIVIEGQTIDVDWAEDSQELAALVQRDADVTSVLQLEMTPAPTIVHKISVGNRRYVVTSGNRMYTVGPTGVAVVSRDEDSGVRKQLLGDAVGLRKTRDRGIVAGSQGAIAILTDRGDVQLEPPGGHVDIVEASPHSPYVIAMVEDRMLVWNLDDVQPKILAKRAPSFAGFVGNDHVLVSFADDTTQLVELATGKAEPVGDTTAMIQLRAAPSGKRAAAIDQGHRVWLVGIGAPAVDLGITADIVGMPTETDLVYGAEDGKVERYDVTTKQVSPLASRDSKLMEIAWTRSGPAWVAARWDDRNVWRKHLATGAEATRALPSSPTSTIQIASDGTVLFADKQAIHAWRPDGTLEELAAMAKPVTRIALIGGERLLAFTQDGTASVVELGAKQRVTEGVATIGPTNASMAIESGLVIVPNRGGIDVIDPFVKYRWSLAASPGGASDDPQRRRALAFDFLQIAPDGRRVLAQTPTTLAVWTLPYPEPAALDGFLQRLTNAVIETQAPGGIAWR